MVFTQLFSLLLQQYVCICCILGIISLGTCLFLYRNQPLYKFCIRLNVILLVFFLLKVDCNLIMNKKRSNKPKTLIHNRCTLNYHELSSGGLIINHWLWRIHVINITLTAFLSNQHQIFYLHSKVIHFQLNCFYIIWQSIVIFLSIVKRTVIPSHLIG